MRNFINKLQSHSTYFCAASLYKVLNVFGSFSSATMTASPESSPLLNLTVKELADNSIHGSAYLPSNYISRCPAALEAELVVMEEIPSIDLSLLRNGTLEERLRIIADIGRACKDWGCFSVVNHGIPWMLQEAIMEAFTGFFNLPEEVKGSYKITDGFDPICHGTSTNVMGTDVRFWRDFLRICVHPVLHCPTLPSDFREIAEKYVRLTREICNEIMIAILKSLELEECFLEEFLHLSSLRQMLVGNLYPPCLHEKLVMGLPSHTDPVFLTLLMQNNTFNGLQVFHDGKWVVVDLIPQSFLLLVGDNIEIVSNGRYKGVMHRATVSKESTRISVGTSLTPPIEGILSPAPMFLGSSDSTTKFRSVTFKEFIGLKFQDKGKNSALDILKV